MEGDTGGLIMMAEAGAEVEAGATESGASEPPQAELAAGQYEDETDVLDDVDEVGKVLSVERATTVTTRPRKGATLRRRRAFGNGSGG